MMDKRRVPLPCLVALLGILLVPGLPAEAGAGGFGARAGASFSPDQFVFGGHIDALDKEWIVRPVLPIVEVGLGDSQTAVSVLADVLVKPNLRIARWAPFAGVEGGLRYTTFDGGGDVTQFAWLLVFGAERRRFGVQVKLNLGNAPDVELLGTYSFGGK